MSVPVPHHQPPPDPVAGLDTVVTSTDELVARCTELGRQVAARSAAGPSLGAVTTVAVEAVPGVAYASVTRRLHVNAFETLGATHPDAVVNDGLQYDLRSGPCLDASHDGATMILVEDLQHDARYPRFGPAAAATGAVSVLSTQLVTADDGLRASLNLYARRLGAFDDAAQAAAVLMAFLAAVAITRVVGDERAAHLERALVNSRTIATAMGILMASQLVTSEQAFSLLRDASQHSNRKIHEIADDVVTSGILDPPPSHTR